MAMKKEKKDAYQKIRNAYRRLKKAYQAMKDSHIEMIFRMALLTEFRDPNTGRHLVRIADYSGVIAEAMGLSKKEIDLIRLASPMHDIGKVMLSDSILKKKGKLTPGEREIMKRHPEVGAEIFKSAHTPIMKACGVIALTHHERFDGTGYPSGLKGRKIPLYGRIVALSDCFDALTSKRPYKKVIGFEESVDEIIGESGTHFDPDVVDAFVKSKRNIKGIWKANKDIELFLGDMGLIEEAFLT